MKKIMTIKGKGPKVRRPLQKKPNAVMKSIKDYSRKKKHKKKNS